MHNKNPLLPTMKRRLLTLALSGLIAVSATAIAAPKQDLLQPIAAQTKSAPAKPASPSKPDEKKEEKKDPKATQAEIDASIASAQAVEPLDVMKEPGKFLNKKMTFTGTFNRFADIGLDYKKAFRDSRDYVTFFILRPDVKDHQIPMAEMKLFFPRKKSDEVMDLESGDKIQIVGTQFSTALDEPWIDVEHIKILEKTPRSDKKHTPEF